MIIVTLIFIRRLIRSLTTYFFPRLIRSQNLNGFAKMEELLGSLKVLVSQITVSPSSSISLESISRLFSSLESNLKAKLAPILKLANLMPLDAPPVKTRVQGGDKVGASGLSKDGDGQKVVGKVFST